MRLVTFYGKDKLQLGVMLQDRPEVLDLTAAAPDRPELGSMLSLIAAGQPGLALAQDLLKQATSGGLEPFRRPLASLRLAAPIPRPHRNIYCIGLNYKAHNSEFAGAAAPLPEAPIVFTKAPSSVIGPGDAIDPHPNLTGEVDYEAELAVVLGQGGRDIPAARASGHIFGYTIVNDVTARDLQRRHKQWLLGKSLDTFCPMGPWLAHRDAVPRPDRLEIRCRVNGVQRQASNTRHLIFDIPTLIATISAGHTLEAGDIIATGTPAGVGMGFQPPRFLRAGDVVEVEIESLGTLRNQVGTAARP